MILSIHLLIHFYDLLICCIGVIMLSTWYLIFGLDILYYMLICLILSIGVLYFLVIQLMYLELNNCTSCSGTT